MPVVTGVSFVGSPASGDTYELGETIEVTVKFHRFIKHSGTPQVELTVGGQTALASFDHGRGRGSGVTELYFEYDVQADDFDADGVRHRGRRDSPQRRLRQGRLRQHAGRRPWPRAGGRRRDPQGGWRRGHRSHRNRGTV